MISIGLGLSACGSDDSEGPAPAPGATTTRPGVSADGKVTIQGFNFKPETITVRAGTAVTWTNRDTDAHAIKPENDLFERSEDIADGASFAHTYDQAGTFPYICGIHNSMQGTVVVL